jgi:hydrogenase expression/formation protein HypE
MADHAKSLTLNCPVTLAASDRVLLGHGSGGRLTADLISKIFVPAFHNSVLDRLDDQAVVSVNGTRLAFTTDSFVVKPLFFPGGDIGSLAVHGTVNDLAMGGALPLFLSTAFIIEEGLPLEILQRVVTSLQTAAAAVGIEIVTGDTKVVEQGSGDELFINTTGIGLVPKDLRLSADQARPGDKILLSGSIGDHGIAILAQRAGLEFESTIVSDSASLYPLVKVMLDTGAAIRCMRDPTRGGVSSALNEIAAQSNVGMALDEQQIPIHEEVRGACEMLGLDPLYVANEGKLIAIVEDKAADRLLSAMRSHPLGRDARIIGTVTDQHPRTVVMRTAFGTTRIVDMLSGDQLPRIC